MPVDKKTLTNNDHVSIEMHVPTVVSASKAAIVKFWMAPVEGIHINTTPIFELRLEKNSQFEIVELPRFLKDEQEYLDNSKPVEFSITVKNGTEAGKHTLRGTLNYFYCSDKDGWCNRFSQKIESPVVVKK